MQFLAFGEMMIIVWPNDLKVTEDKDNEKRNDVNPYQGHKRSNMMMIMMLLNHKYHTFIVVLHLFAEKM